MKKQILIAITLLLTNHFNAQEKIKDTLFFGTDRFYTVSPTLNPELLHQTYAELEETHKEQLKQTGTNGYIYFTAKLDDYQLWEYFNNYVVFLVNEKKKEFTEVTSGYEIE